MPEKEELSYIGMKADIIIDAHLTIVYLGQVDDAEIDHILEVLRVFKIPEILFTERLKIEMFGSHKDIPVVRVNPPQELYDLITYLGGHNIVSTAEYPWNPHITLNLSTEGTIVIPKFIPLYDLGLY